MLRSHPLSSARSSFSHPKKIHFTTRPPCPLSRVRSSGPDGRQLVHISARRLAASVEVFSAARPLPPAVSLGNETITGLVHLCTRYLETRLFHSFPIKEMIDMHLHEY